MIEISELQFYPKESSNGFIGYVSFVLNGSIRIKGISVYTRLTKREKNTFRLVYPYHPITKKSIFYPISEKVSSLIEKDVTAHIEYMLK